LVYETKDKKSNLKVIDFGTAKHYKPNQKLEETFGTAYYMAPEVLTGNYDNKCDVWSCGVIMYILLSGSPPFGGPNDREILKRVKIGKYDFKDKVWNQISKEAKNLIQKLMQYNPSKRITAQEALMDVWLDKTLEKNELDKALAKENLNRLKNFRFESKLQETTWVFLVNFLSTREEKNKLLQTFQALDLDKDGQLTKDEIIKGYVKLMGYTEEEAIEEAERIMSTLDANNSGSIDYSEFVNATISKQNLLTKDRLEAAFKMFDKDGNGKITADEMRHIFNNEGKAAGVPQDYWDEWIKEVDDNGDGGISLKEFKEMMMGLLDKVQK